LFLRGIAHSAQIHPEANVRNLLNRLTWASALAFFFLMAHPLFSAERPPVQEVLQKMDGLYRGQTSQGEMEMTIENSNWKRVMRMKVWSEGIEKTFVVVLAPKKDAGIATLRMHQDMWNFFPRINKTLKVPPSMMMGSWMGSDFTNDDLVKESSLLRDYKAKYSDEKGPPGTWRVELVPKAQTPTVWGKILLSIQSDSFLPVREEFFDEHGEKVRVLRFSDVQKAGDRLLPTQLEITPLKKPGQRTVLRYKNLRFDEPLDPSVFTLQNLRRER
jgi:outer membrane lipoprotein-sorting protein